MPAAVIEHSFRGLRGLAQAGEDKLPALFQRVADGLKELGPRYAQARGLLPDRINTREGRAAYNAYVEWTDALRGLFLQVGSRVRNHPNILAAAAKALKLPEADILRLLDGNNFKPVLRVVGLAPLQGLGVLPLLALAPLLPYAMAFAAFAVASLAAWNLSAGERAQLERERRASRVMDEAIKAGLGPELAAKLAREGAPPPLPGEGGFFSRLLSFVLRPPWYVVVAGVYGGAVYLGVAPGPRALVERVRARARVP